MQSKPRKQSSMSVLLFVKSATTVGVFACMMSTAYPFSVGPLPGLNCGGLSPCSLAPILEQYEEVHQDITRQALRGVTFNSGGTSVGFSTNSLWEIQDANARTDYIQSEHAFHFDNAFLTQGSTRLTFGKRFVLRQLQQTSTMTVPEATFLRKLFGGYLHTVQDFYAHSNYVNLLPPPPLQLGDTTLTSQPPFTFPCFPPTVISLRPPIFDTRLSPDAGHHVLTSGDAINPLPLGLINGLGHCTHGLLGNGIHKDWTGRADHDLARTQAVAATTQFVQAILDNPANIPNNVCMFMTNQPCLASAGIVNFDSVTVVGCIDATPYLASHGVTVTQQSIGTTVSIGSAGQCFHSDVVVPSSPNALYVLNNQPVSFTLNFDRVLTSVSFTRARLNAGSPSGVNTVGWTATAYSEVNAAGTPLAQTGEGAQAAFSPNFIAAAAFTLTGTGIRSISFVRTNPSGQNFSFGVSFAVLDDFVLTE